MKKLMKKTDAVSERIIENIIAVLVLIMFVMMFVSNLGAVISAVSLGVAILGFFFGLLGSMPAEEKKQGRRGVRRTGTSSKKTAVNSRKENGMHMKNGTTEIRCFKDGKTVDRNKKAAGEGTGSGSSDSKMAS